jgi:hypothetical protein
MTDEHKQGEKKPEGEAPAEFSKKRRSERLFLTLPIRVSGTNPKGRDFTEDCVSVNVSRHGARIRMKNTPTVDDVIHVENLKNKQATTFRVVGRVSEPQPDLDYTDWGVEVVDSSVNIWGMELRENPLEETAVSALLQCSSCQVMSSFLLTHKEVGAAGASAYITRSCPRCVKETLWVFVSSDRRQMAQEKPLEAAAKAERRSEERRVERRFTMQVPIRIRTAEGEIEVSTTVDFSRKGARFLAAKEYTIGSVIYVAVPYEAGQEPLEVKASVEYAEKAPQAATNEEADLKGAVTHIEELRGSPKKLYGIKFV